jgi:pimeloyl-ACP methyl ester carboxylesterase
VYFMPYFSKRGFDCYALDLSGHGESEGRERLDSFGLEDYVDDVAQIVATMGSAPILIGHSMGALVVERFLERAPVEAAVLMAPVPSTGTLGATIKLAFTRPAFFAHMTRASQGKYTPEALQHIREVYYSPETSMQDLVRFQHLFKAESQRAIREMALIALRLPVQRPALPVLAIGGELDAVFPPNLLAFTAARWKAEVAVIPRAGHTIMLDAHWEVAAARIARWLERQHRS